MLISRGLRITLLISFLWHLFWLFSVSIIFLPSELKPEQYSSVHFLGSILKSPISFGQTPLDKESYLRGQVPDADKKYFSEKPYTSWPVEREFLNPDSIIDVDTFTEERTPAASFISTKASVQQREIIYQPPLPKYPEWVGSQEFRASSVIFKIYILPDGLVQEIINVRASGNTEIDAALARYIKSWRFAPTLGQKAQWQTVKINLDDE